MFVRCNECRMAQHGWDEMNLDGSWKGKTVAECPGCCWEGYYNDGDLKTRKLTFRKGNDLFDVRVERKEVATEEFSFCSDYCRYLNLEEKKCSLFKMSLCET